MQNKPIMKRLIHLSFGLTLLILLGFSNDIYASHAAAGDMSYTCVNDSVITVRFTLYRDCTGIPVSNTQTIFINSTDCPQLVGQITATQTHINCAQIIDYTCDDPDYIGNCSCDGTPSTLLNPPPGTPPYVYPAFEEYIFEATYIVPKDTAGDLLCCTDLSFSSSVGARNGATNTGFGNLVVEAILDNCTGGKCNCTPTYPNIPMAYACANQPFAYSLGGVDIKEGHSLSYQLVPSRGSFTNPLTYNPPNTFDQPMETVPAGTFELDSISGTIVAVFAPNQEGVIAVQVTERDNVGRIRGISIRELFIFVIECDSNIVPDDTLIMSNHQNTTQVPGTYKFQVCPGDLMSFDFLASDPNIGDSLTIISNHDAVLGMDANVSCDNATNPRMCTFTYQTSLVDTGTKYITIIVRDDGCPIPGTQVFALEISPYYALTCPNKRYCKGTNFAFVEAFGGTSYQWEPSAIFENSNENVARVKRDDTWTSKMVYCDITNPCGVFRDSVFLTFDQRIPLNINIGGQFPSDTVMYQGENNIFMDASTNRSNTYQWTPFDAIDCETCPAVNFFGDQGSYSYIVEAWDSVEGCRNFDTIVIDVVEFTDIFAPNAITPNGDDINDVFEIITYGIGTINELKIFNRWGQVVQEYSNLPVGASTFKLPVWDGRLNGEIQPVGTYVYLIDATTVFDEEIFHKGDFTILK